MLRMRYQHCSYFHVSINNNYISYILIQSASNLSFDEFYNMYREIVKCKNKNKDSHGYMMVNVIDGGDTMICPG